MSKDTHHPEQLGNKLDGSWRITISLIAALVLIIAGALLTVFTGGGYGFIFGLPLVIIGLLIPIAVQFIFAEKRD
jgi:membrane protein YdbS with pleckstrin-like domain